MPANAPHKPHLVRFVLIFFNSFCIQFLSTDKITVDQEINFEEPKQTSYIHIKFLRPHVRASSGSESEDEDSNTSYKYSAEEDNIDLEFIGFWGYALHYRCFALIP